MGYFCGADISNFFGHSTEKKLHRHQVWVLINPLLKNKSAQKKSHIKNLNNSTGHPKLLLEHRYSETHLWIPSSQFLPLLSIRSYTDKSWAYPLSCQYFGPVPCFCYKVWQISSPLVYFLPQYMWSKHAVQSVCQCDTWKKCLFGSCSFSFNVYFPTTGGVFIIFMILPAKINPSNILQDG